MGAGRPAQGKVVVGSVVATLLVVGAGAAGYVIGEDSGENLGLARQAGRADARDAPSASVSPAERRRARRTATKAGYKDAYRDAFVRARRETAAGGPRVCGDAVTDETPVVVKVRAEGIGCEAALDFAGDALACQDLDQPCMGYSCSHVSTNYEEGEITCTRDGVTIRFLTGV